VQPGDVLAIHSKLLHGSGPNRSSSERDVVVVQYGDVNATLRCQSDDEFLSLCDRRGFALDL
jgi:hypothetical protein